MPDIFLQLICSGWSDGILEWWRLCYKTKDSQWTGHGVA